MTMLRTALTSIALVTALIAGNAQRLDYLGQNPPEDSRQIFARGLISTDSIEHSAPAFSSDGKKVLWTIMERKTYRTYLLEMDFINGKWSPPHQPSFADDMANESFPSFTCDGEWLYFSSSRKINRPDGAPEVNRIWKVKRDGSAWQVPVMVDSTILKNPAYASSITCDGSLYFSYGPFRSPDWQLWKTNINKKTNAERLPGNINTPEYEDGPFIARSEEYLIFESNREGSLAGSIDLYICFKTGKGEWTAPVNMGDQINTDRHERFPRVSDDGKYLFFGSDSGDGYDIYWIDASIIQTLRRKADGS